MGLMSPTVIRVAGIVLFAGTIAFVVAGFMGQTEDQTTGSVLLTGVVVGGPVSAIVGVIAGIFWEKLFGPIKSVEHLDMRKNRRRQQRESGESGDGDADQNYAAQPEPPSDRRYTGKGGGKRRR